MGILMLATEEVVKFKDHLFNELNYSCRTSEKEQTQFIIFSRHAKISQ